MQSEYKQNLEDSIYEFERIIKKIITPELNGGEFISIENIHESFASVLDQRAGVDLFQIHDVYGIRAIANRVRWVKEKSYCDFTIRKKLFSGTRTEYEKRKVAINENKGWMYPYITIQSYFKFPRRTGKFLNCAIAKTVDIFDMIDKGFVVTKVTDDAGFYAINWYRMQKEGYKVTIIEGDQLNLFKE